MYRVPRLVRLILAACAALLVSCNNVDTACCIGFTNKTLLRRGFPACSRAHSGRQHPSQPVLLAFSSWGSRGGMHSTAVSGAWSCPEHSLLCWQTSQELCTQCRPDVPTWCGPAFATCSSVQQVAAVGNGPLTEEQHAEISSGSYGRVIRFNRLNNM